MTDIARLKAALAGIKIEDNPAIVKQKSRDFFWYSPVLKRQLDHVTADLVVSPKNEAEVIRVLEGLLRARRAGDAARLRHRQLRPGDAAVRRRRPQPRRHERGEVDRAAAASSPRPARSSPRSTGRRAPSRGQEIRLHPSTYNTASIGGFIAGGSGGIGSINWGGLRDLGNVLRPPRRHHGGRARASSS